MLSTAEVAASTICSEKKDDLKVTSEIHKTLSEVQTPILLVLDRLNAREQDLKSALEHLQEFKAELEPVEEVLSAVEGSVEAEAPVDLNKGEDELGKVDVSINKVAFLYKQLEMFQKNPGLTGYLRTSVRESLKQTFRVFKKGHTYAPFFEESKLVWRKKRKVPSVPRTSSPGLPHCINQVFI